MNLISLTAKASEYVRNKGGSLHLLEAEQISTC